MTYPIEVCIKHILTIECVRSPEVLGSTGISAESVLADDCQGVWEAPDGAVGDEAYLVIELSCTTQIGSVVIRNPVEGKGTKQFSLHLSESDTGPWKELIIGELESLQVGL